MKKASAIIFGLNLFFLINPPFTWAETENPNQVLRTGIYRIHIDGIVYGTPWHMLISAKLDKKTSFDSVSVFSTEASPGTPFKIGPHWSGVRGWVRVKNDGLHYFIRTKEDFDAQPEYFRGILGCGRDSNKCAVSFSTHLP